MLREEIIKHLKYSKCGCEVDYRDDLKVFNGVCPNHNKSVLLVDDIPVKLYITMVKARKLDKTL